jgi:hypothetical protein
MTAPKKKDAKEIAQGIELALVKKIEEKVIRFCSGDTTAAITDDEAKFLQDVIERAQAQEQGDAVVAYLQGMEDNELAEYHERLRKSLEEGEGLK